MKKLTSLILAVLMLAALPGQVFAEETQGEKLTVTLDILSFETDYYEEDVNVVYRNTADTIIADVIDKESGAVLETYEEELESGIRPRSNGPFEFEKLVAYTFYPVSDAGVRVVFKLKIYVENVSGATSRRIVDLLDVTQTVTGNNARELEFSEYAEYQTTATKSTAQVMGTLRTTTTVSNSAQFEIWGYEVSSDNYARCDYDIYVTVYLSDVSW